MHFWVWLNANAGALGSIAVFLSAALTLVTIWVLVGTWAAIERQAEAAEAQSVAARALTDVAQKQTTASIQAAESAKLQADMVAAQLEINTAPLIVAEPDDRQNWRNTRIINRGQGIAFQVCFWQGPLALKDRGNPFQITVLRPSTLAPGTAVYVPIPPGWDAWTIQYKGLDRQERWTIVYADPGKAQEHVMRKGTQEMYLA